MLTIKLHHYIKCFMELRLYLNSNYSSQHLACLLLYIIFQFFFFLKLGQTRSALREIKTHIVGLRNGQFNLVQSTLILSTNIP